MLSKKHIVACALAAAGVVAVGCKSNDANAKLNPGPDPRTAVEIQEMSDVSLGGAPLDTTAEPEREATGGVATNESTESTEPSLSKDVDNAPTSTTETTGAEVQGPPASTSSPAPTSSPPVSKDNGGIVVTTPGATVAIDHGSSSSPKAARDAGTKSDDNVILTP